MTIPTNIKEAILEGGRVVLLAIVSYLLTVGVVDTLVAQFIGGKLDASITLIITGLITSGLRGVDKFLHERGKDNDNNGYLGTKGITGF